MTRSAPVNAGEVASQSTYGVSMASYQCHIRDEFSTTGETFHQHIKEPISPQGRKAKRVLPRSLPSGKVGHFITVDLHSPAVDKWAARQMERRGRLNDIHADCQSS
jgi:hypothetical protein